MKRTILAVLIAASLVWSGAPDRQSCDTGPCAPMPPAGLAGQVATIASGQMLAPRSGIVDGRDCVGFPRWAPVPPPVLAPNITLVTSGLPHWA